LNTELEETANFNKLLFEQNQGAFTGKGRYYFQGSVTVLCFPIYCLRKLLLVAVSNVKEVKSWLKCYQQPSPYLCDCDHHVHMTTLGSGFFFFHSLMTKRKGKWGAQPNFPQLVLRWPQSPQSIVHAVNTQHS